MSLLIWCHMVSSWYHIYLPFSSHPPKYLLKQNMFFGLFGEVVQILLMEEILHQLIGSLFHCLQGFIHPRWCRISSINSIFTVLVFQRFWISCYDKPGCALHFAKHKDMLAKPLFDLRLLPSLRKMTNITWP